jgi:membrane protein insertase Oxa1/YidC/SpoIIIJ
MIIIMGGTMIWQQWTTPTSGDPTQKKIMMFMPVMFTLMFILFPMPAGLVLYWLVNNIMSITQQLYQKNAHGTHPFVATMITSVVLFVLGYLAVLTTA